MGSHRTILVQPRPGGQHAHDTSRSNNLLLHAVFAATLVLDALICIVAVLVFIKPVFFSSDPGTLLWASRLPTAASVVGNGLASLNSFALTLIVTSHAKTLAVTKGLSLRKLQRLTTVANGSFPRDISPWAVFAISAALAKAFIPSALVQAMTPTATPDVYTGQMPHVSLSADNFPGSNNAPDVACEYGLTYGYGWQCPLNNRFGAMYDAGLQVFTRSVPVNYTRFGVTYPNSLSGISGAISTLSSSVYRQSVSSAGAPTASDVLKACVPRMKVQTTCSSALRPGYVARDVSRALNIRQPGFITEFSINGTEYTDMNTFPDYGHGSLVIFGARYPQYGGMSSIFVISNKGYIADLGAGNIECNITAVEEHIPIFIRGGNAVELDTSEGAQIHCPSEAQEQPDPAWLPNLTASSQMVLQKQQGQDGRLEAVMLFEPNATVSRMDRIGEAITRMVSVAATEMYASLYDQLSNSSAIAQYAMQDFELSTPRLMLGNNTWTSLLFLIAPLFFMTLVAAGWFYYGLSSQATLRFNPIDNAAMAAAGMNALIVPSEIIEECVADMDRLTQRCDHIRFRFGTPAHGPGSGVLGLYADNMDLAEPESGEFYGSSSAVSAALTYRGGSGHTKACMPQSLDPHKCHSQASIASGALNGASLPGTPYSPGYTQVVTQQQSAPWAGYYGYMPVQPYQSRSNVL